MVRDDLLTRNSESDQTQTPERICRISSDPGIADLSMHRKLLKSQKRGEQQNRCARCSSELPEKNAVLDRIEAMKGYTRENTRLLCPACDVAVQEERGYS